MWLYARGECSKQHIRIFEYLPDRSGKRPESFLKGFTGCLVTRMGMLDVNVNEFLYH